MKTGARLQELREATILNKVATFQDVSEKTGISAKRLRNLEKGVKTAPITGIETDKLSEYYGVSVKDILCLPAEGEGQGEASHAGENI